MKQKLPSILFKLIVLSFLVYLYHFKDTLSLGVLRIAIIVFSFLVLSQLFHITVIKGTLGNRWKNAFLLLYILVLFCVVCELYFTRFSKSGGITQSLASNNWFEKYWRVNEFGYRDIQVDTLEKKKKIFFMGDSFTAGSGTEWTMDRFSNVFAKNAKEYRMYNLGVCGSDTRDEFKRLKEFPLKPDVLVWQYFGNDMEGVLKANKIDPPGCKPYQDVPGFLEPLVLNSYFFNYIYWQTPHSYLKPFLGYLTEGYKNNKVFAQHLEDLKQVSDYCRANDIKLIVIIFPYLQDLEGSNIYVPRIQSFFEKQRVPVLNIVPLVRNMPVRERIVNSFDLHPSVKVNHLAGEALYLVCKKNKIIN